jgi:hypothetical protein
MEQLAQYSTVLLTVDDGVGRVPSGLILGPLSDELLDVSERNAGWREPAALVVSDDLSTVAPPHGHTGIRRPQVDADRRPVVVTRTSHLHTLKR